MVPKALIFVVLIIHCSVGPTIAQYNPNLGNQGQPQNFNLGVSGNVRLPNVAPALGQLYDNTLGKVVDAGKSSLENAAQTFFGGSAPNNVQPAQAPPTTYQNPSGYYQDGQRPQGGIAGQWSQGGQWPQNRRIEQLPQNAPAPYAANYYPSSVPANDYTNRGYVADPPRQVPAGQDRFAYQRQTGYDQYQPAPERYIPSPDYPPRPVARPPPQYWPQQVEANGQTRFEFNTRVPQGYFDEQGVYRQSAPQSQFNVQQPQVQITTEKPPIRFVSDIVRKIGNAAERGINVGAKIGHRAVDGTSETLKTGVHHIAGGATDIIEAGEDTVADFTNFN